ncbi:hypothetical protein JCM31826_02360 [Thermaurantimonas aggregans]|uniref:PAS domain-containing protein n=3 Tax=Thermaurantimonas aggregans TaxID=2173829 RepID=A0A401XIF5_9FLAO|nr:PAS domain-containing protein [Thermaurantimonas aggregans]GCD76754.1 hypothetical protein JCM31826_02360 [Thermaurantimonas aggregans]
MELSNSTGHFVITLKPIYDKSGKLLGIAHYCLDITSLKKSQEENRILSTRFQTLINQINGIVLIVDLKGKIQYVSDNIKKLSGFDKEFVINRQFSDFIYPDDLPELNQAF